MTIAPQLRLRTSQGRVLAYAEAGKGPDVLLLHGTLTTREDMQIALLERLQRDFHVVALDRPSHGGSDVVETDDHSLWRQADVIRDACAVLGLHRPIVCGHSYGGAVALALAMAHPGDVAGVAAVAPICYPEPRLEQALFGQRPVLDPHFASSCDPLVLPTLWHAMFLPQAMPETFATHFPFARAGRPSQTLAEGRAANNLWFDLVRSMASYATCRVPVRIVAGAADIVVNPLHSLTASCLIPGARLDLLAGMGHMLHHFRPEAVAVRIAELVRSTA